MSTHSKKQTKGRHKTKRKRGIIAIHTYSGAPVTPEIRRAVKRVIKMAQPMIDRERSKIVNERDVLESL